MRNESSDDKQARGEERKEEEKEGGLKWPNNGFLLVFSLYGIRKNFQRRNCKEAPLFFLFCLFSSLNPPQRFSITKLLIL